MLRHLLPLVPSAFGTYHEPFVGGGALFFALQPKKAVLSDINCRLVRSYVAVRDNVDEVVALLKIYPYEKNSFLKMRATPIDMRSDVEVAAWLIYLNHSCFNGLYRVNRSGLFNVPHGDYTRPRILDAEVLRACSRSLNRVQLSSLDFEEACEAAKPGDFVYLDPPYQPLSATSRFTSYTKSDFDYSNQLRLADVFARLTQRGVVAVLSNSDHPDVERLYKQFTIRRVPMARSINSDGCGRAAITELLISNAEIVQERSASPK